MEEIRERIINLLGTTTREGMTALVDWLNSTDFFKAPASTKYHNNHEGGLAKHSLAVYDILKAKNDIYKKLDDETIIITALLHDVCKVNFYTKGKRNVKEGTKINNWGREVANWVEKEVYVVKDEMPLGHGEKSVIAIQELMPLTKVEQAMIRWHMLFTEPKEFYRTINNALDKYPEIILLHTADLEATYLVDKRSEN